MVYLPGEDSYLLKKWVEKLARGNVLDMGTGTGIQAFEAAAKAKKVIAVDANPDAIDYCKNAVHFFKNLEFRLSDMFSKVPEKFDVIIFNPPYLPECPEDKEIDTTGGKNGWETIEKFLKEAKKHLNPKGIILLVFSSLTNKKKVLEIAEKLKYKHQQLDKKHYGFEDIFVYQMEQ